MNNDLWERPSNLITRKIFITSFKSPTYSKNPRSKLSSEALKRLQKVAFDTEKLCQETAIDA
jgi:hypothetical protein